MKLIDKNIQILSSLQFNISFQDLEKKLKTSGKSTEIFKEAQRSLEKMQGKWEPAIVFQWFDFEVESKTNFGCIIKEPEKPIHLDLGHSITFLRHARYVMVSSYTIGQALDIESSKASSNGNILEAYMIDLIGLTALEKTEDILKKNVESQAKTLDWGVSPFLSPGSVHGWELEEQSKLCALIPIQKIDVTLKNDTILYPLKSIIAVIGIGPGYDAIKVGSTCEVCSKRNTCEMKQTH